MPDITWTKDNVTLFGNSRHNIFMLGDVASLRIESALLEDSGVYSCTANNVAGSVSRTAHVVVEVPSMYVAR